MIDSRQTIKEYAELVGSLPDFVIEDYMGLKDDVNRLIQNITPQFGSGSPEGVVTSNANRTYYDTSGASVIMYVNPNIDVNTGWRQV